MDRKPERRHSVELEALEEQEHRPYRYIARKTRSSFPRPRLYSQCPDAESITLKCAEIILQHIVLQRLREKEEENLEREKRESDRRRQAELPGKPKRVIQVDPIISPFDSEEDKTQREDTYSPPWSPKHPDPVPKDTPQPSPFRAPTPTKSPETSR